MKKRILILALAAIMVGCAIGGTMAYYTNQATATNVITAGNIRAELREWADLENRIPYADPEEPIMPGEDVTKIVTVENTGDFPAWIRLRFVTTAEGENIPTEGELPMLLDVNTEKWLLTDGWYYYDAVLDAGAMATPIFTTVRFESAMGNAWQNATFYIDVEMQAVQVANNGDSVLDAAGWPDPNP